MDNKSEADAARPFFTDVKALRKRARQHMLDGAVTESYGGNTETACKILNEALATELVCVLRYKRHYFMAQGINSESVKEEFKHHADEEQQHADMVAERITQLDGEPDLNPKELAERSHSQYVEGKSLVDMIKEDLIAERIAIESYGEIIRWLGDKDPTTRIVIERILEKEEEHADDMANLLRKMS